MNDTRRSKQAIMEPVVKTVEVPLPVEKAFHLFTEGYARWWPLLTHSVGLEQALSCTLEGFQGGRVYETLKDGTQCDWGQVLLWQPPHLMVFTWHPGRAAETAQRVEISFQPIPAGTLLTLTHTGWEILGERAQETRRSYVTGWDAVLGSFASLASADTAPL